MLCIHAGHGALRLVFCERSRERAGEDQIAVGVDVVKDAAMAFEHAGIAVGDELELDRCALALNEFRRRRRTIDVARQEERTRSAQAMPAELNLVMIVPRWHA